MRNIASRPLSVIQGNSLLFCDRGSVGAWPLSAERKIEVSSKQRLKMYVVINGSDGRCIVAIRLIVGVLLYLFLAW